MKEIELKRPNMSGKFVWGAEVGAWGEIASAEARKLSENFAWSEGNWRLGRNCDSVLLSCRIVATPGAKLRI
ncbi:hypothetical protein A2U01_0065670 [Trifolium medium]|uniref:Uncharacterized protein n=1 Tax=Trifolium medium TaxID=97028 RepID=A0A392S6B1_9FABA|nr:hypothetical protein [Trifolium medium]